MTTRIPSGPKPRPAPLPQGRGDEAQVQVSSSFDDPFVRPSHVDSLPLFGHLGRAGAVPFELPLGDGPIRDAFNDLTLSSVLETKRAFHEVLTGAAYSIFREVYAAKRADGLAAGEAMREAAVVMGTLLARSPEHTPEHGVSWEDLGKGMLKVDREYFSGRFDTVIQAELRRRELFDSTSLSEWHEREGNLPALRLSFDPPPTRDGLERFLRENHAQIAAPGAPLTVTELETDSAGRRIVRFSQGDTQEGRQGVAVFRANGSLMELHRPRGRSEKEAP